MQGEARRADLRNTARVSAPLILAVALTLPAVMPLLAPGYFFKAHDAHHSVFWLVEFDRVFKAGVPWPVWSPDHALGFGYPLWLVYGPLAYYAAEIFHLAGLGFTAAIKATWLLGFILGALGTYHLARRWWGPAAGLIAALVYTYAPYHLVQIYVRADLAEFMAWAWFPWALLTLVRLWDDPRPRRAALAALALGALFMIHTVSLLVFPIVLAALVAVKVIQGWRTAGRLPWRPLGWTACAAVLGGLQAAAFLLPGFVELRYLVQSQWTPTNYDYTQQFVYLSQFLSPFWGYGNAFPGPQDTMSFQLGMLPFLGGLIGLGAVLTPGLRAASGAGETAGPVGLPHRAEAMLMVVVTLAALFMMTQASLPLWQVLPFGKLIQFPWRLLALTMVSLALLAGAGTCWLERRPRPGPYVYVLALLIVAASYPYTRVELQAIRPADESPVAIMEFELGHPDMRGGTVWAIRAPADGDSPLPAQILAGQPLQRAAIAGGKGTILSQQAGPVETTARVQASGDVDLRFYIYYFPGWQATVDGQPVPIRPTGPNGLITLTLHPRPGPQEVRVRFGATPVRHLGGALSLAGLLGALGLWAAGRRPRRS